MANGTNSTMLSSSSIDTAGGDGTRPVCTITRAPILVMCKARRTSSLATMMTPSSLTSGEGMTRAGKASDEDAERRSTWPNAPHFSWHNVAAETRTSWKGGAGISVGAAAGKADK